MTHKHHSHHSHEHTSIAPTHKRKAILIAILGAVVVLTGVWLDHLNRDVLLTRDQASNSWSYFHQKSIKERIYESELSLTDLPTERVTELTDKVARYQTEGDEIRARAEAQEADIEHLLAQIMYTEIASTLFELAIILISISLIAPLVWLEVLGVLASVSGLLSGIFGLIS